MDNLNAVQSELQREQAEQRDSLGVNDEGVGGVPYSPYPRTPPFVLPAQDTERDTFDSQDDGCTDSALCGDLEWGGERNTFDSAEEDREPDTLDSDNDTIEVEGAGA